PAGGPPPGRGGLGPRPSGRASARRSGGGAERRADRSGAQAEPRTTRISLTGPSGITTSRRRLPPGHTHSWAWKDARVSFLYSGRVPKRTPHWRQVPIIERRARGRG